MTTTIDPSKIRNKLVIKAVRNIRRGGKKEDASKGMYRPEIRLDLERSLLMTESYKETEGQPMVLRRALALKKILSRMSLYIQDWERLVGNVVSTPQGLFFGIDMNWRSVRRIIDEEEGETLLDQKGRRQLDEMIAYWKGRSMSDIQQQTFSGEVLDYWKMSKGAAGFWSHWSELGIPNYEKIFRIGLRGIIHQAEERLAEIDQNVPLDYVDQKAFLQAVIISLEAVIHYANRYADLAEEKARKTDDPADRERLLSIAAVCRRVPEHPPRTLTEALQSFFFIHVVRYLEYSTLGIGVRFDKLFGPFYQADLESGRTTREEALEMMQLLWVKFHELGLIYSPTLSAIYGGVASLQAITIGGVDEDGNSVVNDMTYLVLETARRMQTPEPTIALRYFDGIPEELLSQAVDVIRTGIGYPAFFNDKAILPMLKKWKVPVSDAQDYAISGCVYIELPGKNIARRAVGGFSLPLAFWYALTQGVNTATGEQIGLRTPDPLTFTSIDDVMDAYLAQVEFFFQRQVTVHNIAQDLYEKYLPRPYYSALLDGCIEKGMDSRKWGYPSAVSDICIILGPTDVADSMAAMAKRIFQEEAVSMETLLKAMQANWKGHEAVRQLMLSAPKYGNDDDFVDAIMAAVQERTAEAMMRCKNRFGYPCRGDGSGISATYAAGAIVPALPDGRKSGKPLADATLSPVFGMDREGPTAVLQSASKVSTINSHNHLLNQKFLPQSLEGANKKLFIQYLRSWGDLAISQIQFNVVDRETLIDAQEHPENHPDLLVRVAGYSAYFVDLSRGLQDSIIARTVQAF